MILPRKIEINKAKADESRRQIDEGMALAHKVDLMREMKLEQEYNLMKWRDVTLKNLHEEINECILKRDSIQQETFSLQEYYASLSESIQEKEKELITRKQELAQILEKFEQLKSIQ